jgi:hypothetical protein
LISNPKSKIQNPKFKMITVLLRILPKNELIGPLEFPNQPKTRVDPL